MSAARDAREKGVGLLHPNVADGVHRVEDAYTNWYLVDDDGRLTVIDCGLPTSWRSFQEALATLGRKPHDVEAVVLTHGHFTISASPSERAPS